MLYWWETRDRCEQHLMSHSGSILVDRKWSILEGAWNTRVTMEKEQWRSMAHETSEIKRNSDQELEWVLSMRILAKNML